MCGRYALALRPSQLREVFEDAGMPVDDAPPDEGPGAPRQTYNFAPGNHGIVYRADTSDRGAGLAARNLEPADPSEAPAESVEEPPVAHDVKYRLQSMKWGLIPFWTKRNPDYGSMLKTINCRDDSLATPGGMWSTMKARKRCVVVAQGFFEWLKSGKEKIPHYVKRKDGRPMCFAGLWDCVQYDGSEEKHYTYTIITTDSNKQLKFLHDRMPVILDAGSDSTRTWLDPQRSEWSRDLQALLRPFQGELECYPVTRDVGKVGTNSPSFIIPVASKENKSNIANFFANATQKAGGAEKVSPDNPTAEPTSQDATNRSGLKRQASYPPTKSEPPLKKHAQLPPDKGSRPKISATSSNPKSPGKKDTSGSQKITKFFASSA